MELTSPAVIESLCQKYGVYPSKKHGQNFLIDQKILGKIIEAAGLKKDDVVLEIGPGFGTLTVELAKRVKKIVAVEADEQLVKASREILADSKNVEIIHSDILELQVTGYKLQEYGYKIVANLPYQITSAVFRKFLENASRPSEMIVMVQKEVAERICAPAGEMSLLSVSVQFFGKPEIVEVVSRKSFWPEPEVDSAILKISNIKHETETNVRRTESKDFFRVVKIGFSARRKQLHNNLSSGLRVPSEKIKEILIKLGFDPKIRAQDLSMDGWIELAKRLK